MLTDDVLVIDSGQTSIKVRRASQTSYFPGLRANASLLPQIADAVGQVASAGPAPSTVLVGTCGLTAQNNDPDALLALCEPHGVRRVVLAHDATTSYLGAVGSREGVVVAAGTGSITLGVGNGTVARVDGWGSIMGDAGGGHWIGRRVLDAVMRAHDGRGPATALTEVVRERYPDLDGAYMQLQVDPDWVRTVATFAASAAAMASEDAVAREICVAAGEQLAQSASTAVEGIGMAAQPNPLISLVGGILADGVVRSACVAALERRWPGFRPFLAEGDALAGTALLATLPSSHPLVSRVGIAERRGDPA